MKQVHIVLQGKGGCGKSFTATTLAQYFVDTQDLPVYCYDTDPINQTFRAYRSLNVTYVPLLQEGKGFAVNKQIFDAFFQSIIDAPDGVFVIDNGATSFLAICDYMTRNQLISLLEAEGIDVFVHTILIGGQSLETTVQGLDSILCRLTDHNVYVWVNHHFGDIHFKGRAFHESTYYNKHKRSILGIVELERIDDDLFSTALQNMAAQNLTFSEAISTESGFDTFNRNRLKIIRDRLYKEVGKALSHEN